MLYINGGCPRTEKVVVLEGERPQDVVGPQEQKTRAHRGALQVSLDCQLSSGQVRLFQAVGYAGDLHKLST